MVSERRTDFEKTDIVMLVLVVVLTVFGLAMLLSASEYNGRVRFGDSAYYFKKQLFAAALLFFLWDRRSTVPEDG